MRNRSIIAAIAGAGSLLLALGPTTGWASSGRAAAATIRAASLPPGVTLKGIDGGSTYYSQWPNSFPTGVYPVGIFPFEASPSSLAAVGVNYGTPMRNDNAGTWSPVYSCGSSCVDDQTRVNAQPNFYSGGDYEGAGSPKWGPRAVFNVFGDELDGQSANGLFDNNPANVRNAASQCGSWGGTTAAGLEQANAATKANDPSRPVYDQVTVTLMDGGANYHYTAAQKAAICRSTGIFSFDVYPIVKRAGNVYDTYDQVTEARGYCADARPVFPFIEMDHMDGENVYPLPAQTSAEVWNAVIAGADGVQYFDQYGTLTDSSYTGNGHYAAGAMYQAIRSTNTELKTLGPVIQAQTASGFVSATGNVRTLVKYYGGHFYLFAAPHARGAETVTFTVPAVYKSASGLKGTASATINGGRLTTTFANVNDIHIYELS